MSGEEDRGRERQAGFDHHLVKPVAVDKVADVLAGVGAAGSSRLRASEGIRASKRSPRRFDRVALLTVFARRDIFELQGDAVPTGRGVCRADRQGVV
jgi:hypothetical protein